METAEADAEPTEEEGGYGGLTLVSSAGDAKNALAAEDIAVNDGSVVLSDALQQALSEYGDSGLYRVSVELFRDGVQLAEDSPEAAEIMDRLAGFGYVTAIETFTDAAGEETVRNTLHLTAADLETFRGGEDFGVLLRLYEEVSE